MKLIIQFFKKNIQHKINFWNLKKFKDLIQKHGLVFLVILITVEIVEHLGSLFLISWLGLNVSDKFFALLPAPLLFCWHWLTSPIIFFIYIKFINNPNLNLLGDFKKNVLKLVASISFAQLIPIIITPILTQYFSPNQFGIYGLYVSVCSILAIIAAGRYDVAIMLPKNKSDSNNILALSLSIAFIFSILCYSILNIFHSHLFFSIESDFLKKYYFIFPISIFLISINQSVILWLNREKQYSKIATQNILKSSTNSFSSLLLGFQNIISGLIIGHIVSLVSISLWNIRCLINNYNVNDINLKRLRKNFNKYIDFFKFSTISNLFNSLSNIGMTTIIVIFFGPKIAGLYFLAEKIIVVPISLLTTSISQVYFEKASKLFYVNKLKLLYLTNKIQRNIFLILLPFLIILSAFGEFIFGIFGSQWIGAGIILKYFSVFILFKCTYSPISHIGDILNKQKVLLIFNVSLFLFQLASFYFLKDYHDIKIPLLTASLIGAAHYLLLNRYMKNELKKLL